MLVWDTPKYPDDVVRGDVDDATGFAFGTVAGVLTFSDETPHGFLSRALDLSIAVARMPAWWGTTGRGGANGFCSFLGPDREAVSTLLGLGTDGGKTCLCPTGSW